MIQNRILHFLVLTIVIISCTVGCSRSVINAQIAEESIRSTEINEDPAPLEPINRQAYQHYVNGLLYDEMKNYLSAAEHYRLALKFHPDSKELGYAYAHALKAGGSAERAVSVIDSMLTNEPRMLRLKATCYMELHRFDDARRTFLKLTTIDTTNSEAFLYLATIYGRLGIVDSLIWSYEKASSLQPKNYLLLNELARVYQKSGNWEMAIATLNRSLTAFSGIENLRAMISLAAIYQQNNQLDSAVTFFNQGLNLDPDNMLLHREVARLRFAQDSADLALPHIRTIANLSPNDLAAQQHLGIILFSMMKFEEADSLFSSLVENNVVSAPNHMYLGRIALNQKNYIRARNEFLLLVQLEDSVYDNWEALAFTYRQLNDPEKQIETYLEGLDHMNNEGSAVQMYFSLGATYERNGNLDSAIASFEYILDHHPDHAQSLNYLGYSLADRGTRLDYALELIERAVELQPDNPAFLDSYGWVLYRLKEYDNALHYLSTAANLADDPVIYDHLADTYDAVGDKDKAHSWWRKALEKEPDNASEIKEKLAR